MMTLDELTARIRKTAHWLDVDRELPMMYDHVTRLKPGGLYFEVGTFLGTSAIAMALAAPEGVEIHTIDNGAMALEKGWTLREYLDRVHGWFEAYGVVDKVQFYLKSTADMEWARPIDMLYIDGGHDTESVLRDIERWTPFVIQGNGVAIFHDAMTHKSVKDALDETLRSDRSWIELDPAGSMCRFERAPWMITPSS